MRRAALLAAFLGLATLGAQGGRGLGEPGPVAGLSLILGRPTDRSATLSVLSETACEAYVAWGPLPEAMAHRCPPVTLKAGVPTEVVLEGLPTQARTFYRLFLRRSPQGAFEPGPAGSVQTQRAPGSTFSFALQGDSHPERRGKMFDPALYARALGNAAQDRPDFYLTLGDDFSVERLINRQELNQANVDRVYAYQRGFLGLVGASSALFLVNGNHEQAARYLLDGTDTNAAVLAGRARTRFFPLPAPDGFYTGDAEPVAPVGLLRDYYAWTWGDALFVVLDPYWHSPVPVDNRAGEGPGEPGQKGGKGRRDLWQLTLGEDQYRWLEKTLLQSRARWKFVFAHHVNGTGRGGVEEAHLFEWGGQDRRPRFDGPRPAGPRMDGPRSAGPRSAGPRSAGPREAGPREDGPRIDGPRVDGLGTVAAEDAQLQEGRRRDGGARPAETRPAETRPAEARPAEARTVQGLVVFHEKRPGWALPIHALMVKAGVTIFFQGHDHLYAKQELDGVIYQTAPNPADPTGTAFNREAYRSGEVLPNAGHLRVTVEPDRVQVDYIRAVLPPDGDPANGKVVHSYTVRRP